MSVKDYIIMLLFIIPMQGVFIYNYGNITNQKAIINKKYFITIIFTGIMVLVNNYYNLVFLRIITGILINIITSIIIYKEKFLRSLFYSSIHAIVSLIVELLLVTILAFNIQNLNVFNNSTLLKCSYSIILGVITIFIFKNKKVNIFIDKIKTIIFNKVNLSIIVVGILLFLNFIGISRAIKTNDIFLIIVTLICIIFMILTIRIIVNDKYNMTILNEKTKNIRDSLEAYSKTIDDCRELKHNLKNDLFAIKSDLPTNKQDKINQIINKYNSNYEWINTIDQIPDGLQGLIYLKQKEAERRKIKIYINTLKNIKTNDKDYIDLCSIMGILLDNAMDAACKTKEKIIEISFKQDTHNINIKIINSYNNDIDINKIGKKNYSTKEYKSGLGLNYVKKLNNPKIKVNFKIINNLFITNVNYTEKK